LLFSASFLDKCGVLVVSNRTGTVATPPPPSQRPFLGALRLDRPPFTKHRRHASTFKLCLAAAAALRGWTLPPCAVMFKCARAYPWMGGHASVHAVAASNYVSPSGCMCIRVG
jgi:hypothetical protein